MYDIAIIGAGPAGLTAALYAGRAGKSVLLLDNEGYGGQIKNAHSVENYPAVSGATGAQIAEDMYSQVAGQGAVLKFEKVLAVEAGFTVVTRKNRYEARCVIAAVGTKNRPLGVPGESEFIGRGVSYCALCDGALFKDKTVCVVGGGNTALQDAIYLAKICKKVYLIHRRNAFRGDEILVSRVKTAENVTLCLESTVKCINGAQKVQSVTLAGKDGAGEKTVEADGVFIAVGKVPDNKIFEGFAKLDGRGYFAADENCETETAGFFAAGDCRAKRVNQLTTAVSDGACAATAAVEYLNSLEV